MTNCDYREEINKIIEKNDARTLVNTAHKIAQDMTPKDKSKGKILEGKSVTSSQIRNIYGTCKKIDMSLRKDNLQESYRKLLLLKPMMAYANGRHNKRGNIPGFTVLTECLSYAIDKIEEDYDRMKNFLRFFEAILAYHKYEGGN